MGDFRVEVNATGGHGCQRTVKSGQQVQNYCGSTGCPDCIAREFVRDIKRAGHTVRSAELTHWPGTETEVKDDLITGTRTGNF
jgi:hypothetical protein